MGKETSKRYVTVRDPGAAGSKDGSFFINVHSYDGGGIFQSNNYEYKQKRTARRIAKRLAKRKGYEYRQDMEYTASNFPRMTAPLVGTVSGV